MAAGVFRGVTTQGLIQRLVVNWDRFWFREIPPDVYALLRIAIGTVGLVGILGLIPVSTYWTPDGIVPLPGGGIGLRTWLNSHGMAAPGGWLLFGGLLGGFTCMVIGFRSGSAVTLCFFLTVVQGFWNRLPLSGVHDVTVALLFCLLWADTGARLSVDAWLARRRSASKESPHWSRSYAMWPLRLMRIQVSLIYFNTGLWKLFGEVWRDGSAIQYALDLNTFQRSPYSLPAELEWLGTVATYTTLVWEIAFPFMMFNRWTRMLALGTGVTMHLGMFLTMELGMFSWMMMASYLAFLDPHQVSRIVSSATPGLRSVEDAVGGKPVAASAPSV